MGSFAETAEARIMEAAIPSIRRLCLGKWNNLEYQDRVSEVRRIFLEDLRTMPLNTGHFLEEFRADLEVKMGEINRRTPSTGLITVLWIPSFPTRPAKPLRAIALSPRRRIFPNPK